MISGPVSHRCCGNKVEFSFRPSTVTELLHLIYHNDISCVGL